MFILIVRRKIIKTMLTITGKNYWVKRKEEIVFAELKRQRFTFHERAGMHGMTTRIYDNEKGEEEIPGLKGGKNLAGIYNGMGNRTPIPEKGTISIYFDGDTIETFSNDCHNGPREVGLRLEKLLEGMQV